jgi:uncharacterized protein YqjF (DUF2071 family)
VTIDLPDTHYDDVVGDDDRPWVMAQKWEDILFAHWPFDPAVLRPLVPSALEIQERDGSAWVSVVALRMAHLRIRDLGWLPLLESFPELNLRTYVTYRGRPGVWFLRIEASNLIAVEVARKIFDAPYVHSPLTMTHDVTPTAFTCGEDGCVARLEYAPNGNPVRLAPNSLEEFLCERYALYTCSPDGELYRGDIRHSPWTLTPAQATVDADAFFVAGGLPAPTVAPTVLASSGTSTVVWWPEKV